MDESICIICEASFRPNVMDGDKCKPCASLYPDAKSREDIRHPNQKKAQTLTDVTVREIVYEILEEANIKRHKCEKCGKMYFRTSPAQKICKDCKNRETK